MYYPLHVHTATGSIGDSILRIDDYADRAKAFGLKGICITDHGSLSAMFEVIDACQKRDLKPVIGMEAYIVDDADLKEKDEIRSHLVLIAKNDQGLKNLLQIHNDAQLRGFYVKPRTDHKALEKWHEGLICTSACVAGEIPQAILKKDFSKTIELLQYYKGLFGADFFLEIQPGSFQQQLIVNDALVYLSQIYSISVVATNDIHYLNKEDYLAHDYHIKVNFIKDKEEFQDDLRYPDICYWMMTEEDLKSAFHRTDLVTESVINNSIKVAEQIFESCNITVDLSVSFPETDYEDNEAQLRHLVDLELLNKSCQYKDRAERELSVINKKGFAPYFLVLKDLVDWCKEQNILLGPGRGSAAGCLVAFLLGITKIDPVKYNLMFERFLDENRTALPDIDIDLQPSRRHEAWSYLINKYGQENCAQISAIHYRKAKASIKDACRILKEPVELADAITSCMHETPRGEDGEKDTDPTIDTYLSISPELRQHEYRYPEIFSVARMIEDLPRASSVHAAGIVISSKNLREILPLRRPEKEGDQILKTTVDLESAEKILIKFDLLGLTTLDILDQVQKKTHTTFDWTGHNYGLKKVWNLIDRGKTSQVFQMKSNLYRQNLHALRPKNIQQLADTLALLRGPSVTAQLHKVYEAVLQGAVRAERVHSIYDEITRNTCGIIIYQEQVMELCVKFGMSATDGYKIVKLGAKKDKEGLKEYRDLFYEKGKVFADLKTLERLFDLVVASSAYSFNRSHAISYAVIAYATAAYCVYYPGEYLSSYIDIRSRDQDSVRLAVNHLQESGFKILPPDINDSNDTMVQIDDHTYRLGFNVIKNIGSAGSYICSFRESHGAISSLEDFYNNRSAKNCNLTAIKALILARCFESLEPDFVILFKRLQDLSRSFTFEDEIEICKTKYKLQKRSRDINFKQITGIELKGG